MFRPFPADFGHPTTLTNTLPSFVDDDFHQKYTFFPLMVPIFANKITTDLFIHGFGFSSINVTKLRASLIECCHYFLEIVTQKRVSDQEECK